GMKTALLRRMRQSVSRVGINPLELKAFIYKGLKLFFYNRCVLIALISLSFDEIQSVNYHF
ncbi:MAG: hypothetical protein RR738_02665, partial [Anaerorhabdus sp.]|uniref:hypothetical protein n=1 Tax=Anaerorhabdus sp. TaxID=1872524 RepID=UPI002FCA8198